MRLSREERKLLLQRRQQTAKQESPTIAEAIDFYSALTAALIDEEAKIEAPALDEARLQAKLSDGEPILHGESLGFDEDAIRALLLKLCGVTEQFGKVSLDINPRRLSWFQSYKAERDPSYARGIAAAKIRRMLAEGELNFDALMEHLVGGNDEGLKALADSANLDGDLLATLARFAMRPTMLAYAETFESAVGAHEDHWMRSECPLCGSPPVLSEYYDQAQARRLRCATCGVSWKYHLLQCASCGNDQFRELSFIKLDGDERHQADACKVCMHYVKGVRTHDSIPNDLLPLEDLLTLSLDAAAQQQGYQRM